MKDVIIRIEIGIMENYDMVVQKMLTVTMPGEVMKDFESIRGLAANLASAAMFEAIKKSVQPEAEAEADEATE